METKQSVDEMQQIQSNLSYRCMFVVPSVCRSGGLALLWKEEVDLHIQTYSPHIQTCSRGPFGNNPTWRLTRFYG